MRFNSCTSHRARSSHGSRSCSPASSRPRKRSSKRRTNRSAGTYFRRAFVTFSRRARVVAEHLAGHVAYASDKSEVEIDLALLILRRLLGDENTGDERLGAGQRPTASGLHLAAADGRRLRRSDWPHRHRPARRSERRERQRVARADRIDERVRACRQRVECAGSHHHSQAGFHAAGDGTRVRADPERPGAPRERTDCRLPAPKASRRTGRACSSSRSRARTPSSPARRRRTASGPTSRSAVTTSGGSICGAGRRRFGC